MVASTYTSCAALIADNPCAGRIVAVCIHRPHTLARKMDAVHIESWARLQSGWGMTRKVAIQDAGAHHLSSWRPAPGPAGGRHRAGAGRRPGRRRAARGDAACRRGAERRLPPFRQPPGPLGGGALRRAGRARQTMEAEIARMRRGKSRRRGGARHPARGRHRLPAVCVTETGLFRTAFATPEFRASSAMPARWKSGLSPLELLSSALDELVGPACCRQSAGRRRSSSPGPPSTALPC